LDGDEVVGLGKDGLASFDNPSFTMNEAVKDGPPDLLTVGQVQKVYDETHPWTK
jgi:hypothetical protein